MPSRLWLGALALIAAPAQASVCEGQIAFLHHVMAVIDRETADAVSRSDALRRFASLEIRTTLIPGKEPWAGRYVNMTHNYLELFGPGDSGDDSPVGSIGLAIGGDAPGVTDRIETRLRGAGAEPDRRMTQRTLGGRTVDWFASVRTAQPVVQARAPVVKAWSVEFQRAFFAAPEARRAPSQGPQDMVSRRRYLADAYKGSPLADISGITLSMSEASYRHDVLPLLAAAGFCIETRGKRVHAWGGEADIRIRFVDAAAARLDRVDFALSTRVPSPTTLTLGASTLRIGPGRRATWRFDRR